MAGRFPILLTVAGKAAVVVGGGKVALRKVRTLLERGARPRVVSPALEAELEGLVKSGAVAWTPRAYQDGDLAGAFLAVAATNSAEVNQAVGAEARRRRVLVNLADDPGASDFIVPSFFSDGPLTVAVATAGQSPAASRTLRRMIQAWLGPHFGPALELINRFREDRVKASIPASDDRVRFWESAVTPALLELARAGDLEGVTRELDRALGDFIERHR